MKKKKLFRGILGLLASGILLTSGNLNVKAAEKDPLASLPLAPMTMKETQKAVGEYAFPVAFSPSDEMGDCHWMPVEYDENLQKLNFMDKYGNEISAVWNKYASSKKVREEYPLFGNFYQHETGKELPIWTSSSPYFNKTNLPTPEVYAVPDPTYKQHRYDRVMGYDELSHEYRIEPIPVLRWELAHYESQCVHTGGGRLASYGGWNGDGSTYVRETATTGGICGRPYYSGVRAICAYCGQDVTGGGWLMYMTPETASRINVLDAGRGYIFVCPYDDCKHLEQGSGPMTHTCIANSQNKYTVVYRTCPEDTKNDVFQEFIVDTVVKPDGTTIAEYEGVNNPEAETALLTANNLKGSNKFFEYKGVGYEVDYFELVDSSNNPISSIEIIDAYGNRTTHSGRFECGEILYNTNNAFNLSVTEGDTVYMMAHWKAVQAALVIDPNGGTYTDSKNYENMSGYGANGKYVVTAGNSALYWVNGSKRDSARSGGVLSAPSTTYSVTFDCDPGNMGNGQRYVEINGSKYYRTGGGSLPSVKSNATFESWSVGKLNDSYVASAGFNVSANGTTTGNITSYAQSNVEVGTMSGEANMSKGGASMESPMYRFASSNSNTVDIMTANWKMTEVVLPNAYWPHKNNEGVDIVEQCMGWYTDPSCDPSTYYGAPGDKKVPDKNIKVYAKFGVLTLEATENYVANNKKGASDLYWNDSYNGNYYYTLFQTNLDTGVTGKIDIRNLTGETERNDIADTKRTTNGKVTVKESGAYNIVLAGASGGWYHRNATASLPEATFKGGDGALLSVDVALLKGDVITYYTGTHGNVSVEAGGWSNGGKPTGTNGSGGAYDNSLGSNGGGATRVVITRGGTAIYDLYAGGGGGANQYGNGGNAYTKLATGNFVTRQNEVAGLKGGDHYGENGVAGGGGGYFGGKSAVFTLHTHVPGVCPEHDHKVNGCRGQNAGECGSTEWREVPGTYRHSSHYGGGPHCDQCGNGACAFSDPDVWAKYHPGTPFGTPSWCDTCGAYEWGHAAQVITYECVNCGYRKEVPLHTYPDRCTQTVVGHWECGEERYLCGLKIDNATQSFGSTSMASHS